MKYYLLTRKAVSREIVGSSLTLRKSRVYRRKLSIVVLEAGEVMLSGKARLLAIWKGWWRNESDGNHIPQVSNMCYEEILIVSKNSYSAHVHPCKGTRESVTHMRLGSHRCYLPPARISTMEGVSGCNPAATVVAFTGIPATDINHALICPLEANR